MRADILQRLGLGALAKVKENPTFPYDTGNLKFIATSVSFLGEDTFRIVFDETIAPYIKYLEEGTKNSTKHQGFISQRATDDVINYLANVFNVSVGYKVTQGKGEFFGVTGGYKKTDYKNPKDKKDPFGQ
jgi:hypothetical protein